MQPNNTQVIQQMPPDLLSGTPPQSQDRNESNIPYVSMELGQGEGVPPVIDQEEEDNHSISPSMVSSVMTADGIHDMTGFLIVCMVILIGDMSRGVMFPTLWPLVENLGGSELTLGISVASFSGGRILVNPVFGSWSLTLGYTKTLLISCSILFCGTLFYAQVQNIGAPQFLILAQITLGIGSGTLGVTRAFVADVTAKRNRTTYMAWVTAVQYAGFTVTPFIGALFAKILGENEFRFGLFRLNMFTAPAYFMSLATAFTLFLLAFYFQDRQRIATKKPNKKSARRSAVDDLANSTTLCALITVYDACILGCMLLNISTKGSIGSFETLGILYAGSHFGIDRARAGTIVASCGTLGVMALLGMGRLTQIFNDVQLISGGMIIMAAGVFSLAGFDEGEDNPTWRYMGAMFLIYSVGYPIGHTAIIGLFSKIVGRRPQGVLMGWFSSAGSFSRIVFPIVSGLIARFNDISTMFAILTFVLVLSTMFVIISRHALSMLSN